PIQTLLDKDLTKINAFIATLSIKHQLCFWHCLRAIKICLAILGRHPAFYNADDAFQEYNWIDRTFVPINQICNRAQFDDTNDLEKETVFATPSGYSFCPAPHRSQALHIFTKHFCKHPLLPGCDDRYCVAKEIHDDAVHEMYMFCYQRGLRELWGYMWTLWYYLKKWQLWARSTSPYLCRL
ncbi:hypothetical protein CPB85DRAFT_1224735, partial [Mucidula mucida]